MKKKILAMLLCAATLLTFTGCGNGGDNTETAAEENAVRSGEIKVEASKQVSKLSDYEKIPLTITGTYDVTDEMFNSQIEDIIKQFGLTVDVTDHNVVQDGDIVNVDYTGYLDGTAFDNGSATGALIDVTNNQDASQGTGFIDGFSAGLVGASVGSEVSSDVTFPESYQEATLAGKLTTFKFKVNSICRFLTMDELTDEIVNEKFASYGFTTVQDLKDDIQQYLDSSASSSKYNDTVTAAKAYVLENSTIEIPDDYFNARVNEYQSSFEETNGDIETYATSNNIDVDDFKDKLKEYVKTQVETEFAFLVIADKAGIKIDEDEFATFVQNFVDNSSYGFSDTDAVYKYFGNDQADEGEAYMRDLYLVNKAIDYVVENADVTVQASQGTEAQ